MIDLLTTIVDSIVGFIGTIGDSLRVIIDQAGSLSSTAIGGQEADTTTIPATPLEPATPVAPSPEPIPGAATNPDDPRLN